MEIEFDWLEITIIDSNSSLEKKELNLINYLSKIEINLINLNKIQIIKIQTKLIQTLLILLTPSNNNIKPGRLTRNIIARILSRILSLGDSKPTFNLCQSLLNLFITTQSDNRLQLESTTQFRVAAAWSLGQIWSQFGQNVMSLFVQIILSTTKVFKSSALPVILRCSALITLRKVIYSGGKSISDQLLKDTIKALKSGLSDRAGVIGRECAECLLAISVTTPAFTTLAEINDIITPSLKTLEHADHGTRRSISRLIASLLSSTQVEGSAAPIIPPKKKKGEEEEVDSYPTIGVPAASDGVAKTLLSPVEMLSILSTIYNKSTSSRRLRNGMIDIYSSLFTSLGASWVEHFYPEIVRHLIDDIGCGQAAGSGWSGWNARVAERIEPNKARYEALAARKSVAILLRDVISGRLLSEPGQIMAAREIGSIYLKKWPSLLPSQPSPSKQALVIALDEIAGLLQSLGCAPASVQDTLYDSLVRLVSHPSHSIQITASWALRTFCGVAPTRLSSTINHIVDLLSKELSLLDIPAPSTPTAASTASTSASTSSVHRRAVGHAHALAALINIIPHQPLYVSFDLSAKCMSLAIQLLKQSGNHELKVSGVEIQVVWIIVGSLMSLGPYFVRLHLPQLLILWRNALPKPTSKDAIAATVRGEHEWAFLLHIRECTLGAILSFLRHNGGPVSGRAGSSSTTTLINDDVGRRLVALLSNALAFATSFSTCHSATIAEQTPSSTSTLNLIDRDAMYRRRILECFVALGQNPSTRSLQVPLLQQVVVVFSDPDRYTGESSIQAAIAASAGAFNTVWDEVDGYGFGVTTLMREVSVDVAGGDEMEDEKSVRLNRDLVEAKIEDQLRLSILDAPEHDPMVLSAQLDNSTTSSNRHAMPTRPPVSTGVIDASIELFALYFPLQESPNQGALLQSLLNNLRSGRLEKNPGRRMAILANSLTAILGGLRVMMRAATKKQVDSTVANLMREFIKDALLSSDTRLRSAGAEALGRLSALGGTGFMGSQIQFCVNQVVTNTDPSNRAGCALAFGEIYSHVGGLAAGPVLKTIVEILLSLAADPHPLVHFYALQALSQVIGSASLSYSPFINPTLGLLERLYMQESHEPKGGSAGSVNLRGDLPAYQPICRVMDELIGILGPELQESEKIRSLVLVLLHEFVRESDEGIIVEATKATQHFLMFSPTSIDHTELVSTLRSRLTSSTRRPLKVAAVNSIYQLVQRDAALMSKLGGDGLVSELFALLDDDPSIEGVRDAITSWLRQTADANPSGWIDLCQRIMSRSGSNKSTVTTVETQPAMSFTDEESQGLGLEAEGGARPGIATARTTSRWRTQLFALQCLHEVFLTVIRSGRREHFDMVRARAVRANKRGLLVSRVADLIKMAFTASTAQVMEIRLEGLVVLRDVIENFNKSQDLDFDEALLLDQYQAPIAAALTPAFASDSYPEVLSSAVQVCAIFVGSGVVKEIEKMGRILKLLTAALESCRESDMSSLGDVKDLSSTAAVMLKTSIFAAWAQFQTASVQQPYLVDVIKPHLPLLCPFWVASLREYARVRTDPDATSSDSGVGGAAFDSVYSGLSRETALPFYEQSWPQMLHAVATLLKAQNIHMLKAIDGIDTQIDTPAPLVPDTPRDSPALFFWVLFGLSFEALCAAPPPAGTTSQELVQAISLEALTGLIRPEVSGSALLQASLFEEVCNLCYRLAITEGSEIKVHITEIVLQLAASFAADLIRQEKSQNNGNGNIGSISEDSKMTQCLRVATCVLQESIPSINSSCRPNSSNVQGHVVLLKKAFTAFADLADLYPMPMREELYCIAFHFYSQLLKDETSLVDLVEPTLPILKSLITRAFDPRFQPVTLLSKTANGLLSACLQNIDDVRGRKGIAVTLKTKNNLLASVLLLTSLPTTVKISQAAAEHACYLITRASLSPDIETSTPALYCLTALLHSARSTGILQFCAGQLLPSVIEYIARAAELDYKITDGRLVGLGDVVKCFVGVLSGVREEMQIQSLSLILPTLILLLSPTSPTPSHSIALTHLIALASLRPAAFRSVAASLGDQQRKLLEESIRAEVSRGSENRKELTREIPKIQLKLF